MYVEDSVDLEHGYYCAGVVWRTVLRQFAKNALVMKTIRGFLLSKEAAGKAKLPCGEVNARYCVCVHA